MKPIFIVKIKKETNESSEDFQTRFLKVQKALGPELSKDYHCLFITISEQNKTLEDISFECFFPQDFEEIKIRQLQQVIIENLSLHTLRDKIEQIIQKKPKNSNFNNMETGIIDGSINVIEKMRNNIATSLGVPQHLHYKFSDDNNFESKNLKTIDLHKMQAENFSGLFSEKLEQIELPLLPSRAKAPNPFLAFNKRPATDTSAFTFWKRWEFENNPDYVPAIDELENPYNVDGKKPTTKGFDLFSYDVRMSNWKAWENKFNQTKSEK